MVAGTMTNSLNPTNKFLRKKIIIYERLWQACDDKLGMPSAVLS